jgi:hypothetical protein
VLLKPATEGTSVVAGGSIRSVAELAGISDLLSKSLGSSNKINCVTATIKALSSFNPDIVEKVKKAAERSKPKGEPVAAPKIEPVVTALKTGEKIEVPVKDTKTVKTKSVKAKKAAAKK